MASVNRVILIGNLGADPEVRQTSSGTSVASLRLATNEVWNDKSGNRQERTEWHRITVWGRQAEHCGQYLSQGRQVYVEGRLQTSEYTDKEGIARKSVEVVADRVVFLGGGGAAGGGRPGAQAPAPQQGGSTWGSGGGAPWGGQNGGWRALKGAVESRARPGVRRRAQEAAASFPKWISGGPLGHAEEAAQMLEAAGGDAGAIRTLADEIRAWATPPASYNGPDWLGWGEAIWGEPEPAPEPKPGLEPKPASRPTLDPKPARAATGDESAAFMAAFGR